MEDDYYEGRDDRTYGISSRTAQYTPSSSNPSKFYTFCLNFSIAIIIFFDRLYLNKFMILEIIERVENQLVSKLLSERKREREISKYKGGNEQEKQINEINERLVEMEKEREIQIKKFLDPLEVGKPESKEYQVPPNSAKIIKRFEEARKSPLEAGILHERLEGINSNLEDSLPKIISQSPEHRHHHYSSNQKQNPQSKAATQPLHGKEKSTFSSGGGGKGYNVPAHKQGHHPQFPHSSSAAAYSKNRIQNADLEGLEGEEDPPHYGYKDVENLEQELARRDEKQMSERRSSAGIASHSNKKDRLQEVAPSAYKKDVNSYLDGNVFHRLMKDVEIKRKVDRTYNSNVKPPPQKPQREKQNIEQRLIELDKIKKVGISISCVNYFVGEIVMAKT
jgi:hypothetical protein